MATTDTMLVGSFKDRSLSNLHVKKKIRRLSYAPFPRKGNQGYSNKNRALRNDHSTNREEKKKKTDLIYLQRKAISLTRIRPPLESITSRNRKRQILTSRLEKKKKKKRKESMSKKLEGEFAS